MRIYLDFVLREETGKQLDKIIYAFENAMSGQRALDIVMSSMDDNYTEETNFSVVRE